MMSKSGISTLTGPLSNIVGAIEVKRPGFDLGDIGQTVDYMHELRAFYRVRHVFAALTTYGAWKFLWLEDSDEAAQDASEEHFSNELCSNSPSLGKEIPEAITVHQSSVFMYNDLELIETISSFVVKLAYTPSDWQKDDGGRSPFLARNRQFQEASIDDDRYAFEKLPSEENLGGSSAQVKLHKFSYSFPPHGNTKTFYFLRTYHRTGDGRVALSTTASGNISVFKFSAEGYEIFERNLQDERSPTEAEKNAVMRANKAKADAEAKLWNELWRVKVSVRFMLKKYAMIMPFVFHARLYPSGVRMCPLESWNFRGNEQRFLSNDIAEDALIECHC